MVCMVYIGEGGERNQERERGGKIKEIVLQYATFKQCRSQKFEIEGILINNNLYFKKQIGIQSIDSMQIEHIKVVLI